MGQQIVIAGDRDAGLEIVESLLLSCGMARPLTGGTTRCTPQEVIRGMDRALPHGAGRVSLQAGAAAWQALAADSTLANLEQPLWGWADAGAVRWLPLWQALDPTACFVLVYDNPESVLQRFDDTLAPDAVSAALQRWQSANETLLDFQLRHPESCILMHVGQACRTVGVWARLMKQRIPAAWEAEMNRLADFGTTLQREACASGLDLQRHMLDEDPPAALRQQMQQAHPAVWQLHEEIQAAAGLPRQPPAAPSASASAGIRDWAAWFDRSRQLRRVQAALQAARAEVQALHTRGDALATSDERSARELARMSDRVTQIEARCDRQVRELELAAEQSNEQVYEVDRLVGQLQLVQEELERARFESQGQARELERAQAEALARAVEHQRTLAAVATERSDLVARLGQLGTQIEERARSTEAARCEAEHGLAALRQENANLIEQLLTVQARLDAVPDTAPASSNVAPSSRRPHSPEGASLRAVVGPLGAADRVRSHLSYRLGARMIACSRHFGGWLTMPFQLASVAVSYRRERRARHQQPVRKLPPIAQYRDAQEADRVRGHLSYRLGQALILHASSPLGWVQLPFALRREIRQFRTEVRT